MIIRIVKIMLLLVSSLLAATANASLINLTAHLDGAQAGTSSTGSGSALMTLDHTSNLLSWNIAWSGLIGDETVMHLHGPAVAGVSAAVQINIGSISGVDSPSIGSTVITAAQSDELLAGLWYVNLHTTVFPAGELRGQISVTKVPAPTAAALLGIGLIILARVTATKQLPRERKQGSRPSTGS